MKDTASAVSLQLRLVLFGKLSAVPGAVRIVTSLFVAVCLPRQALGLEDSLRSAEPARAGRAGSRCVQGAVRFVTALTRSVSFLRSSSTNWNLTKLLEVSFYSAILHFIDLAITYEPFFTSSILI